MGQRQLSTFRGVSGFAALAAIIWAVMTQSSGPVRGQDQQVIAADSRRIAQKVVRTNAIPGAAAQIRTVLPGQTTTLLPDGTVLTTGGVSVSGTVNRMLLGERQLSIGLARARAWHSTTVLPDGS